MGRQIRADYDQIMLFPPSVEDWIGPEHPARFVRAFVDSLDLEAMGFEISGSEVGRPGYAADLLLKVWLYGYLSRIRSTRRLEQACREHMGLIWLTGMKVPDHNSLWRFCDSHKKGLGEVFKKSVQVAASCELVGMVVNAVDGTKIRAASSGGGVVGAKVLEKTLERVDRSIAEFMTEVERREDEEIGEYTLPEGMCDALRLKQEIQRALEEVKESGQQRVHPREPEARFMRNRRSIDLSYNAQAVADPSGIIVAADVVNEASDNGQLVPMLDQVKENVGTVAQENLADGVFFSSSQIGLAEERKYEVLISAPSSESPASPYPKANPYHTGRFIYDEDRDCCICPQGQELPYWRTRVRNRNKNAVRIYRCHVYGRCPHRRECSKNKQGRKIEISVHHKALERQRAKREDPEKKRLLARRKAIIEPVFAWIKRQLGFERWTVFGLERVKAQWMLICSTINLSKLYRKWLNGGLKLASV